MVGNHTIDIETKATKNEKEMGSNTIYGEATKDTTLLKEMGSNKAYSEANKQPTLVKGQTSQTPEEEGNSIFGKKQLVEHQDIENAKEKKGNSQKSGLENTDTPKYEKNSSAMKERTNTQKGNKSRRKLKYKE